MNEGLHPSLAGSKLRYGAVSTVSNFFLNKKRFQKTLFPKIFSRSREKEPKKKIKHERGTTSTPPRK
jgi:hypothetical protein